jgi:hypothetical protein
VALLGFFDLGRIALLPVAVRAGEAWRLFTFLLVPPASSPVFIAFAWYMFYLMGSALEHFWGDFRYNLFLLLGWALTVAAALPYPLTYATNEFLAGSVFLAFAFLNPDFELLIFFILPVKMKWLALLLWLIYGYLLVTGSGAVRLGVLAAIGNFLVFFAGDIVQRMKSGRRRMEHQTRVAAARADDREPRHRCTICGKTDLSDPQMDFRYCSKCANDECYCADHIANHTHTTVAPKA